jgi:zinc transport system permease protein
MLALSLIIIAFFVFFFRQILNIAFDEEFARISGLPVTMFNYLTISLVALTVVLNIRVVGIILILSLLTIPQATANLITRDFKKMILFSIVFAIIGSVSGLFISYFLDIPSGPAIIFTLVAMFGVLRIFKPLFR